MNNTVCFIVPPPAAEAVVRDYAAGLGFERTSGYVLPPLDLFQLAAIAAAEWNTAFFDFSFGSSSIGEHIDCVLRCNPTAIVIQASLPTITADIHFARSFRSRGIRVLTRLPSATIQVANLLDVVCDGDEWLLGECEDAFLQILRNGHGPGLCRGTASIELPVRVSNLDQLPFPDRELGRRYPYRYPRLGPCTTVLTSRGCPFSCKYYCPYPLVQGDRWRARSVQNVLAELKAIWESSLAERILFRDAVFTLDQGRIIQICAEMSAQNLDFHWWCETRADLLERDTIDAMSKAGCKGVNIGVETGDESLRLKTLKTQVTDFTIKRVCRHARNSDIKVSFLMMLGWPGETRESLCATAELIATCRPCSVGITFPTAYPGTRFHADVEKQHAIRAQEVPTGGELPQIHSPTLTAAEMIEGHALVSAVAAAVCNGSYDDATKKAMSRLRTWTRAGVSG
jgi:radical SAM superfamily enzyme YgiQ (UPF0313 family)